MTGRYRVRTDQLQDLVDHIARFDSHLEEALAEVDSGVNQLHATWAGAAADEHRAAHDRWVRGADEMRAALSVMQKIVGAAHDNYTSAAAANLSMWELV